MISKDKRRIFAYPLIFSELTKKTNRVETSAKTGAGAESYFNSSSFVEDLVGACYCEGFMVVWTGLSIGLHWLFAHLKWVADTCVLG